MTPLMQSAGPWVILALLGAYHGINPGMGWLFAVALGLQERNRKAVIRAFAPIALGHAVSIGVVVLLFTALRLVVPINLIRYVGAGLLIAYGVYKLVAPMSHPRWVGMRVGFRDLTVWSFLMATAHGAGLMLVPILMKLPTGVPAASPPAAIVAPAAEAPHTGHAGHAMPGMSDMPGMSGMPADAHGHEGGGSPDAYGGHAEHMRHLQQAGISGPVAGIAAVLLHTGAMFLTMAIIAVAVYEKVGLAILRRAWFNLDLLWAIALIGAGVLTFVL